MGLMLKTQRDGKLRPCWYGVYRDGGRRRVVNLNVKVRGTPPKSLSLRDQGDTRFEKSRDAALKELEKFSEEAQRKGRAEHLTERLIESKTGRPVEYARLTDLPQRWRARGRDTAASERHLAGCDARFRRFIAFMQTRNPSAVHLYEVTDKDAAAFVADLQRGFAPSTVQATVKLIRSAFSRFLPIGTANPFAAFKGARSKGESIHRKPFTPEELAALLDAAREDGLMHALITTAACTGLRRADVCCLPWSAVDWQAGMLTVKTKKTEADIEIPIFSPLKAVLKEQQGNRSKYVFPAAARMLKESPHKLSREFKKLVVKALNGHHVEVVPDIHPPRTIKAEATKAVMDNVPEGKRRDRMLDALHRYCAGESYGKIYDRAGYAPATISGDLHEVEEMIGKRFVPVQAPSTKPAIRETTQVQREIGHAASVRDWHALRATFVTLALSAGVPMELVRRVTGHATVDIVLKYYFRPDREQFRAALAAALPEVLTGPKRKRLRPADELVELATKVAAGNATAKDKARLRKLAAKV